MKLQRLLVRLSYRVADAPRYHRVKRFVYTLLEDPNSRIRPYFDMTMVVMVLASVSVLVYESYEDLGPVGYVFEFVVVILFIIEYLLRFWICSDSHRIIIDHFEKAEFVNAPFRPWPAIRQIVAAKWAYVRSPLAIVDLLAIIPTYRPVRMLRFFMLFRLFKLFRYANSLTAFAQVLREKRFELMALSTFLAFLVFGAAAALVIFEVENPDSKINGIFDGVYWALVTVSTVGYGDIVPATLEGRLVTIMLILAGLGTFSFLASIIVSAFSERLPELRLRQVYSELERRGEHTILCGFGRVGQEMARALEHDGTRFVVVDRDEEQYRLAKRRGYLAVVGNAEEDDLLDALCVASALRILCLTGDDVVNVYITVSARYRNASIEIIARANHAENVTKLKRAGADRTVTLYDIVGSLAVQYIGQPVAYEAMAEILSISEGIGVDAIRVTGESNLAGQLVGDLEIENHKLILFGVLSHREGESDLAPRAYTLTTQRFFFNPRPTFHLEPDDLLVLFGHELSVSHFKERLARKAR